MDGGRIGARLKELFLIFPFLTCVLGLINWHLTSIRGILQPDFYLPTIGLLGIEFLESHSMLVPISRTAVSIQPVQMSNEVLYRPYLNLSTT